MSLDNDSTTEEMPRRYCDGNQQQFTRLSRKVIRSKGSGWKTKSVHKIAVRIVCPSISNKSRTPNSRTGYDNGIGACNRIGSEKLAVVAGYGKTVQSLSRLGHQTAIGIFEFKANLVRIHHRRFDQRRKGRSSTAVLSRQYSLSEAVTNFLLITVVNARDRWRRSCRCEATKALRLELPAIPPDGFSRAADQAERSYAVARSKTDSLHPTSACANQ